MLQGYKVPLFALSKVGRSNATRSNYTSNNTFISIGGVPIGEGGVVGGPGILARSVTVNDAINDVPTTAQLTFYKYVPVEGTDLIITLGSKNNLRREFGGTVVSSRHRYVGDLPVLQNMVYDAQLIDYSWGLNRKKVSGKYTNASVATIAAAILVGAPGYTLRVAPDIGATIIDEITFSEQPPADAFHQLVKRVGGDWFCDYSKVIQLFFNYTESAPPQILNRAHRTLRDLQWTRDLSQVVTRVYADVGGSEALEAVAVGASLIPVGTAAWYAVAGGTVLIAQQRVNYTGIQIGGGGSLVGPGAAPTGIVNATLLSGAGVDVGSHDYSVTYKTASGESIPGPRLTIPIGIFLPPTTAPTAGAATAGATGPDTGVHDYAVTFVIATGDTVPGPRMTASTALLPAPTTAPTPDRVDVGPGPDPGTHDYAVSFIAGWSGETPPGPIGGQITTGGIPAPTTAPTITSVSVGTGPAPGDHQYGVTFVRPEGETTGGPSSVIITTGHVAPPSRGPSGSASLGAGLSIGSRLYAVTFVNAGGGETTPGPPTTLTTPAVPGPSSAPGWQTGISNAGCLNGAPYPGNNWGWAVTYVVTGGETVLGPRMLYGDSTTNRNIAYQVSIPIGPACTVARRLYRTGAYSNQGDCNTAPLGLEKTINDNSTTATLAGVPCSTGGPSPADAALGVMNLTNIPLGPSGTVARKLYRSVAGGQQLQYLATINDNNYSVYTDTTPDANLGANAPTVNTTDAQTVHLSGIQVGPSGSGVIARRLYRSPQWQLVATINDNTTTTFTDTVPDANLGAAAPAGNTTTGGQQTVHVSGIPTVSGATNAGSWRALYRRSGGAGLRFVAYIQDNTTTTYSDTTPNASLGAAPSTVNNAVLHQIPLSNIPIGSSLVVARRIYRTRANTPGGTLFFVANLLDNTTTTYLDTVADANLGGAALTVGTAQAAQVQISAIPLGAAVVIARRLYRTKAGLTPLQLLTTLNDNTTTTYLDVLADAALGAVAPTSDTSLLQQPSGNVLQGSTSMPVANVGSFLTSGGWVIAASQILRYTGITGNSLTGIPATGPGSIGATLTYNSTIVAAPMLTGVPTSGTGTIRYPIVKGDRSMSSCRSTIYRHKRPCGSSCREVMGSSKTKSRIVGCRPRKDRRGHGTTGHAGGTRHRWQGRHRHGELRVPRHQHTGQSDGVDQHRPRSIYAATS